MFPRTFFAPFQRRSPKRRLSAVVLSYNKEWVIRPFFASLQKQTRKPDQVVVVDDASTDRTSEVLVKEFHQYQIIRLPENRGQSAARNVGFHATSGDYIIFLDGDIIMKPDMLAAMERVLENVPNASIAYCHYDRSGSRRDHVRSFPWDADRLKRENYISMVSMIRRKDMPSPPLDESLRRYEDWDLWIRMMKAGKRGALVDQVLFVARYQPDDLSGSGESIQWREIVEQKHGLPSWKEG